MININGKELNAKEEDLIIMALNTYLISFFGTDETQIEKIGKRIRKIINLIMKK